MCPYAIHARKIDTGLKLPLCLSTKSWKCTGDVKEKRGISALEGSTVTVQGYTFTAVAMVSMSIVAMVKLSSVMLWHS